jgi:hypothetical protein
VVLGGGKEYAAVEAMRPHCSNCATVETLPLLDGDPRRSGNSVYLDGRRRAGPDLGPTCPDLGSDFFYFSKPILGIGWKQPIQKIIYFLYPKNSIGWADRYEN